MSLSGRVVDLPQAIASILTRIKVDHRPVAISFSGIDGAGKSTNIAALASVLTEAGLKVKLVAFWDDVVVGSFWRTRVSTTVLRGETGVGTPEKPVRRRDKNFRPWYAILARCVLHFFDAVHLRLLWRRLTRTPVDVIIFDRYIYDQLASLPIDRERWLQLYARCILKLAPDPDVSFLLDAEPQQAYARKPEYPVEFLESYRRSYLKLGEMKPHLLLLPPAPLYEIHCRVIDGVARLGLIRNSAPLGAAPAPASKTLI